MTTGSSAATVDVNGPVVGVLTTQIYCRPDCRPGRSPSLENCVPFPSTGAARDASFRACKKCAPDQVAPTDRRRAPSIEVSYAVGMTPVGFAIVSATPRGICGLDLLESEDASPGLERFRRVRPRASFRPDSALASVFPRVIDYLAEGRPWDDLPLDLDGTPFQLRVWQGLMAIPRGTTTTYGGLARSLGLPTGAARAVGTACGSNRVSLLVPCHRVVRSGGGLGGYFWGLDRKRLLLDLEASNGVSPTSHPSEP